MQLSSMSFPTRPVVLGLIARRPSYGYAVLQQLRRWSIRPAAVRTSSVYTALSRLAADGLVEARPSTVPNDGRPARIFHRITAAGLEQHESWLTTIPTTYEELRLRVALARPQDTERLAGFVTAAERSCLARLRDHSVVPTLPELLEREPPWEYLCSTLLGTLDVGELSGRVQWLRDARVALEQAARPA
jgi:DNA-binding PadR family transcriptional regulator